MSCKQPTKESNKNDIIKEFNENYKNYLESKLLLNLLTDLVSESEGDSSSGGSFGSMGSSAMFNMTFDEKIRNNFWKAKFISENMDKNDKIPCDLLNELKIDSLNNDEKHYLLNKLETRIEGYTNDVNDLLSYQKDTYENNGSVRWTCGEASSILFDKSKLDDVDQLAIKLKLLIDSNDKAVIDNAKLDDEIDIKLSHCLNISFEIINLLKRILNDFKLEHYHPEKRMKCEQELLSFDLLLNKIKVVFNEIIYDLYKPEKLQSLSLIKNHMNIEMEKVMHNYEQAQMKVNMFKSLGNEFENIYTEYAKLKETLKQKMVTLKTLKEQNII